MESVTPPAADPIPAQQHLPSAPTTSYGPFSRLPRSIQVLAVWAAASALTFLILRLGAQDTPATPWGGAAPSWEEHMSFWDAGWYNRIVEEGYPERLPVGAGGQVVQNTWAFMPLLSALVSLLAWTGWSFYTRAAIVSILASAGAALVMDRWLSPLAGRRTSLWAVALVWSSPCAAVLQVPYAESLGMVLVGLTLWLASRGRALAAIPFALAACFARPVGVPLGAALGLWWAWEVGCARGWLPASWSSRLLPGRDPLSASGRWRLLTLALLTCAAALAWPAIAWLVTGRQDAYTATETSWRGADLAPFAPWLTRLGDWVGPHLGLLLLAVVLVAVGLLLSAPGLRSLGPAVWFWCLGYLFYLLAFFDPTTSVLRLLLPLAPAGWALATAAGTTRRRLALLAACVVGQLVWVSWVWDFGSVSIQWVP
ncbi:Predicted integral membrane protein [Actinomyces viscosus]|uniref:Predicted integral membrane protein n=1 Tax=Actinomyces viscosus TaxID=1656 RepID=A0A3S4Z8U7_ACTVI|nr:Predicted integral membrane protein [Actinomyces viscosus]